VLSTPAKTVFFTRTWLAQDPDLFDAAHFRLSRTEAVALDPQARLLLEVAAEVSFPASNPGS